ncbi:DNA-binding SARP family transcriptional activator [Mesorhizobium robiniae]|uniref:DNA-binding SARP family transcriptional activator n=1 Tax=Mesorhizobium robiniae TaxID=559315 RepID=A0ABV2GIE9_9HYPH
MTPLDSIEADARRPHTGTGRIAKLAAPRSARILRRNRVLEAIELKSRSGVCWVAAPAGYGKTTAVIDYLESVEAPHVWFRIDEGDQDIARFFQYLGQSIASPAVGSMPVFGVEYAEQPKEFARRFFRAYFTRLRPGTILVLDDLHDADTPEFRAVLSVMFHELPETVRCICVSRTLPQEELGDLVLKGQMAIVDRRALEFSTSEARDFIKLRSKNGAVSVDVEAARGWAIGLALLADHGSAVGPDDTNGAAPGGQNALSDALGRHFFLSLPAADQDMLLKLNLLPEISAELADVMIGSGEAGKLLDRLYKRQLMVTRTENSRDVFHLHDLLRDFLDRRFAQRISADEQKSLKQRAAKVLADADRYDEAIHLALQAEDWERASELMLSRAEAVLAQGHRTTFIEWVGRLPQTVLNGWHFYWLGVAHMPDDAAAEHWLSKAWRAFGEADDQRGLCLTVSRAVLVKSDSWRTYEGLSAWTRRAFEIIERGLPELPSKEAMLVRIGMVRALNFGDDYYGNSPAGQALETELLERLTRNPEHDPSSLRLLASESLIEHSVSTMRADLFTKAVDSVVEDLSDKEVSPWVLGMWLVEFGAKSGRYFPYKRRGFPYPSAEAALREAIAIGERESLKGVEFGGLYHLQMQMKFRNDFAEFHQVVERLAETADSRFSTQVAVVANCYATLHARQGDFAAAYQDCERFMAASEAANEPMVERWAHYITKFQVLLADRKPREAATFLRDLLPRLNGGARKRTEICILAAVALENLWDQSPHYGDRLKAFIEAIRDVSWPMVLLNVPDLLAELLGDALDRGIEPKLCRSLIQERRLDAPQRRPAAWPWPLKVHVLGGFRLELDGKPLHLGAKPPTKALDILRVLAISKDNTCSLETLQDWLWPDLDGDQARAACEQALHRLRKLLGRTDLIAQREGKLRLASDKVWVDLADWDARLKAVTTANGDAAGLRPDAEALFRAFPGPLFLHERTSFWSFAAAEKVRRDLIDFGLRVGQRLEATGNAHEAHSIYMRTLDLYPDAGPVCKALIKERLARRDFEAAVDEYARYERALDAAGEAAPAAEIRALVEPYLVRHTR